MPRKDLIITTASVDGVALGVFRTFSGGNATAPSIKSSPGAGQGEVERGGRQQVSNVTIGREDDGTADLAWLMARRGKGRMIVHRTPTDPDGNPYMARQRVFTGVLLDVNVGDGDIMSTTDLDDFTLVMGCDSAIG
jgi:hypothetical protein